MTNYAPFAHPLYVTLKPAGSQCNLACRYCYYLEKNRLYDREHPHLMTDGLLERFTREYIEAQTMREVLFSWHGGEPLIRPISFYRKAMELQRKYAGERIIDNCIQTNGILLTDEWCHFFKENNWLVGISIDGPEHFHDTYRRNRDGEPSFVQVMKGIELLNKHGVMWNAMAVVNKLNGDHPIEFYQFFKQIDCRYIQFTPIVERINIHQDGRTLAHINENGNYPLTDFSVTPHQWGEFLCTLFNEWIRKDVGTYFIQLFDATLANWVGEEPGICSMSSNCGHASVMEFNGDVYSCDHFVFPEYKIGNIHTHTLVEMLYGEKQKQFANIKKASLPTQCKQCKYLFACHGECPKNRFSTTPTGEKGLNYLCEGYKKFFDHVAPYMSFMAEELKAGRTPANVMNLF